MSPNLEVSKAAAAEIDMEKVGQETTATDKPEIDDEPEEEEQGEKEVYPPWKRVAVIMAALYCTMFIVALVGKMTHCSRKSPLIAILGPHDFGNCNPKNHGRLSFYQRCRGK